MTVRSRALISFLVGLSLGHIGVFVPARANATPLCDSLTAGRFDIIYICPAAWRAQVRQLAIHRASFPGGQFSSIVAPSESIATCFGAGRSGIRLVLAQAIQNWSAPPKHVVLIGAYRNSDTTNFIVPTWFIPDPSIGFWPEAQYLVPTDDPYVFAPASPDSVPAVSIGRIPVWNLSDLAVYVNKVIAYELAGPVGWKQFALHAIEDRDFEGNSGTIAKDHADSLATYFADRESYNFTRSILYAAAANPAFTNYPIIPTWNSGVGFAFFYGTAGYYRAFAQFSQNNFDCNSPRVVNCTSTPCVDGDTLATNAKTPVIFAMTCGNAYTGMLPGAPSTCTTFSQYLLSTPGKGAVVLTGPARAIHEIPAYAISREWFIKTFGASAPFVSQPGRVLRQVKATLMAGSLRRFKHEILQMAVLGDPALQFAVGGNPVIGIGDPPGETVKPIQFSIRAVGTPSHRLAFTGDFPIGGTYDVRVYDVVGREVSATKVTTAGAMKDVGIQFPDGGIPSGLYFLVARNGSLAATAKLVLVR